MERYLKIDSLKRFIIKVLEANNISKNDGCLVADVLLKAELWNIKSHGISRLKRYVARLNNKTINSCPNIKIKTIYSNVLAVDGDNGLGCIVMNKALDKAELIANKNGICIVGIKNSNHFGITGYYCERLAKNNFISIGFSNALAALAPWGGSEPYLGTNPIAFGFPKENYPIIVDMATSAVARGKIILAAKKNNIIPIGWAVDKNGQLTNEAKKALEGLLMPMAGPKGYALSLAIDIMCGVLTGALYGNEVGAYKNGKNANIGHLFIILKKDCFIDNVSYEKRILDFSRNIHSIKKAPDVKNIYLPGEREYINEGINLKRGIGISEEIYQELIELKDKFNITDNIL